MKRLFFWISAACLSMLAVDVVASRAGVPSCQFASSVVDFSSEFTPEGWSAQQALGPPNTYPVYLDISTAWASETADDQPEFLVLGFDTPEVINFVNVYETLSPGALTTVSAKNAITGDWEVVWTAAAAIAPEEARIATAAFPETSYPVSEIRLDFDSPAVPGWNEIDAVSMGWSDRGAESRFASSVVDFSSEYDSDPWSAQQALGPPDTYPNYGDFSTAWASATADDQPEFLVLEFDDAAPINYVDVYETYNPGALDSVEVMNPNTGQFETVWTEAIAIPLPVARIRTVSFPETRFPVDRVRLHFDSPAVADWNEIDAVGIGRCACLPTVVSVPPTPAENAARPSIVAQPNPFREATELRFSLPRSGLVRIDVVDVSGRRVAQLVDGTMAEGNHTVRWDRHDDRGNRVAGGLYLLMLDVNATRAAHKIVVLE